MLFIKGLLLVYESRIVAFMVAATVTWLGNRYFTFQSRSSDKFEQWQRFLISALISAAPNFVVFSVMYRVLAHTPLSWFIAMVSGVLCGMVSNFILSNRRVFRIE